MNRSCSADSARGCAWSHADTGWRTPAPPAAGSPALPSPARPLRRSRGPSPAHAACRAPAGARSAPPASCPVRCASRSTTGAAQHQVGHHHRLAARSRRSARWWRSPCRGTARFSARPSSSPTMRTAISAGRGERMARSSARTRGARSSGAVRARRPGSAPNCSDSVQRRAAPFMLARRACAPRRRRRRCAPPADGAPRRRW